MAPMEPELFESTDLHRGLLAWRLPSGSRVLSSAPVRGGAVDDAPWIVNAGVPSDFARHDLDVYVAEVAAAHGHEGAGIGLLTAAKVALVQRAADEGVVVDATVGIGKPTWAAATDSGWSRYEPGTINLVVQVPAAFESAAAVNLVMTATEAKTQALFEAGVPGTGTASDAVVVVSAVDGVAERFGGPRSLWGARVARAVRSAVAAGIAAGHG